MRRRRLRRRLFWTGIVLALLVVYVALMAVRLGIAARDLVTRKARFAGLPRRRLVSPLGTQAIDRMSKARCGWF